MDNQEYIYTAIIFIMVSMGIVVGSLMAHLVRAPARPLWRPSPGPIWEAHAFPHREEKAEAPFSEPVKEDPQLEAWIAAELEKEFIEEAPPAEPVKVKRMVLTDTDTGEVTDLLIAALFGEDGSEVSEIEVAVSAFGQDDKGTWWAVDLKEFSWDPVTVH